MVLAKQSETKSAPAPIEPVKAAMVVRPVASTVNSAARAGDAGTGGNMANMITVPSARTVHPEPSDSGSGITIVRAGGTSGSTDGCCQDSSVPPENMQTDQDDEAEDYVLPYDRFRSKISTTVSLHGVGPLNVNVSRGLIDTLLAMWALVYAQKSGKVQVYCCVVHAVACSNAEV